MLGDRTCDVIPGYVVFKLDLDMYQSLCELPSYLLFNSLSV